MYDFLFDSGIKFSAKVRTTGFLEKAAVGRPLFVSRILKKATNVLPFEQEKGKSVFQM